MEAVSMWIANLKGSDIAAWVQALGSIGAIFVAIAVSKNQARNAMAAVHEDHAKAIEREKLQREESLMIALCTLFYALNDAKKFIQTVQKHPDQFIQSGIDQALQSSIGVLQKFPCYELPIARLTPYIIQCPNVLIAFSSKWEFMRINDPGVLVIGIVEKLKGIGELPDQINQMIETSMMIIALDFRKRSWPMPEAMKEFCDHISSTI